ncbi:TonB-dependent receptor plug domain-containing protein [Sphingoaurantiacus capsulatus]|uniref:TonB-dependent receptor plug domain-containing protein n=1 Tax=Sphingoaurantiacus capsulatus TaxID=1771310 RepID=A0ABV7X847_9SPHN
MKSTTLLRLSAALLPLAFAAPLFAQEATTGAGEVAEAEDAVDSQEIVVTGELYFRNRTLDANPVLSYDLEYFQRFEPVSVGEMLKRVPGVTFTSDVLEYDGVQMRGLPSGFTQVLINGRRPPGGESDRSFFVDRLPAELVERIEIVRAPRADQPSEGVAGTLNVVTKESASFDGGFLKGGVLMNEDGKLRPSGAIAYADGKGDTTLWGALNYQGRRNPKKKTTDFFDGEFAEYTGRELQDDTRDGTDISGNFEVTTKSDAGRLRINALVVDTDRDEDEVSTIFEGDSPADLDLDSVEIQRERISQQTYALAADGELAVGPGDLGAAFGWSGFRDKSRVSTEEGDDVDDVDLVERETLDIRDSEFTQTLYYAFGEDDARVRVKVGIDLLQKERDGTNRVFEIDGTDVSEETGPGAIFTIKEKRYDPYARVTFTASEAITIDGGLRYEITRRDTTSDDGTADYDAESLNPSLHLRWAPSEAGQFRASVARTVRRPDYDLISPYTQEEEPADEDDLVGNPGLANERAWGVDVGYEHRVGSNGIVGVNIFYRDVSNLIELVDTGEVASGGGNVYTPQNIGDGKTWGIEFDLSTSLAVAGLPDTGVFANYTYLDSDVTDPFTGLERRFNGQPHHVYNIGFIHNLRSAGVSFGASLSGRSRSLESQLDETVELRYGRDLEAFIEKRFADAFVVRLSAQNLLDRKKKEDFRFYDGDSVEDILEARAGNDVEESELESERSGALFQLTLRAAF